MKPKSFLFYISLGVALLLFCGGCDAMLNETASASSSAPGAILFQDDFSNPSSGWKVWNQDGETVEYHKNEAGLRILVQDKQYDFWSVAGKNFADTQIEVDAFKLGGPDDNDFGILCRYVDKDNFYAFLASNDGFAGIAKMKDGQYSLLGENKLKYNRAIAHGDAINHLRADCNGTTLRWTVNGQLIQEAQDSDFTDGDVGLLAGSYENPGVDILFRQFMVKQPE